MNIESIASSHVLITESNGYSIVPGVINLERHKIKEVVPCRLDEIQKRKSGPKDLVYLDKLVSPGFINSHTHVAMSVFRYLDSASFAKGNMIGDFFFHVESLLTKEDIRAFSRLGAYENLSNGNTLVWDHYYHGDGVAEAMLETGLCGVVAPTLQDLDGPGKQHLEREWSHLETIVSNRQFESSAIYGAFGPHATETVSKDLWLKISQSAKRLNLPLHFHMGQTFKEYSLIKNKRQKPPLAWLLELGVFAEAPHTLMVHNTLASVSDLKQLKKYPVTMGVCPFSAQIFLFPADPTVFSDLSLNWTLGTDCVASNDSMNLQKEIKMIAGSPLQRITYSEEYRNFLHGQDSSTEQLAEKIAEKRAKLWKKYESFTDPKELLKKVWDIPGKMHPQFNAGAIKANHLANFCIWDIDHPSFWPGDYLRCLAFGDTIPALHNVISAGKKIGVDGYYHSSLLTKSSYSEHLQEAKDLLNQLQKRLN